MVIKLKPCWAIACPYKRGWVCATLKLPASCAWQGVKILHDADKLIRSNAQKFHVTQYTTQNFVQLMIATWQRRVGWEIARLHALASQQAWSRDYTQICWNTRLLVWNTKEQISSHLLYVQVRIKVLAAFNCVVPPQMIFTATWGEAVMQRTMIAGTTFSPQRTCICASGSGVALRQGLSLSAGRHRTVRAPASGSAACLYRLSRLPRRSKQQVRHVVSAVAVTDQEARYPTPLSKPTAQQIFTLQHVPQWSPSLLLYFPLGEFADQILAHAPNPQLQTVDWL